MSDILLIIYNVKIIFLGRHYVVNRKKVNILLNDKLDGHHYKKLNEPSTNMYYAQV